MNDKNNLIFTKLQVRAVNLPLNNPIVAHIGTYEKWPYICVDVYTKSGIIGKGYIGPYLVEQLPSIASCMRALADKFINRVIAPSSFFDEGMRSLSLLGYSGIGLYALAGLDIAFWDAHAKSCDNPLAVHLGGTLGKVKTYNSRGLWLNPISELAEQAHELKSEGNFKALKLRIGRNTIDDDLNALVEVKKGAGNDTIIFSDFNQCMNYGQAIERLTALDDAGFAWFEEPIKYNDINHYSELTRMIKTPINIGENFHGPREMHAALKINASDMVMPDLMRIGGVSGWLRASSLAEVYDIPVSTHLFPEVSAHLMRVTPNADWLEWTDWANLMLANPFKISDGEITIPDVAGNGLEWNEEVLEKYSVPC